jgi:hypothetical protein
MLILTTVQKFYRMALNRMVSPRALMYRINRIVLYWINWIHCWGLALWDNAKKEKNNRKNMSWKSPRINWSMGSINLGRVVGVWGL